MTGGLEFLLMGGFAALIGGGILLARAHERKRREAYQEFCLVRGFTFEPERPEGERRFADAFDPFNQGRRRQWRYTINGTRNQMPFIAFEYQWVTGSGKSTTTHQISGVVWERDDFAFPKFSLNPEGWFSKLGAMFGMQDIDFEDSPEFSNLYRLKGPDEAGIRALFTPTIRHFFAATPGQQVAGGGRFLFWWHDRALPPVDKLDEWLEQSDQVRRRFVSA
jgi:hypothetical protein